MGWRRCGPRVKVRAVNTAPKGILRCVKRQTTTRRTTDHDASAQGEITTRQPIDHAPQRASCSEPFKTDAIPTAASEGLGVSGG